MSVITIPPRAQTARKSSGPAWRDPADEPCVPGKHALWPGGPALPLWAEHELATASVPEPAARVIASGKLKRKK